MVLAYKLVTERGRYENAGGEIGIFEDGEAVAFGDGVGIESLEKSGVVVLGVLPVFESRRQVGVNGGGAGLE